MQAATHCCYKDMVLLPDPQTLEGEAVPKETVTPQELQRRYLACKTSMTDKTKFFASQLIRLRDLFTKLGMRQSAQELTADISCRELAEGMSIVCQVCGDWNDIKRLVDVLKLARLFPHITQKNRTDLKSTMPQLEARLKEHLPRIVNHCPVESLQEVVHSLLIYDPSLSWVQQWLLGLDAAPERITAILQAIQRETEAKTAPPAALTACSLLVAAWTIIYQVHTALSPHPVTALRACLWLMEYEKKLSQPIELITPQIVMAFFCKRVEFTHCKEGECQIGSMLKLFIDDQYDWIRVLVSVTPDSPLLNAIVASYLTLGSASGRNYQARCRQFRHIFHESFSMAALLKMAIFIENEIAPRSYIAPTHYPKQQTGLVCSFFVDPARKDICVLADEEAPASTPILPQFTGRKALYIPNNAQQPAGVVLELRTEAAGNAALLHQTLQNRRGIAPLFSRCDYTVEGANRISLLMRNSDTFLRQIYEGTMKLTDRQLLSIFIDLAHGLLAVHQRQCIFGGICLDAAQVYHGRERKMEQAVWYHFGCTFSVNQTPFSSFLEGLYGHGAFTAPELYRCGEQFPADLFKVDVWALGSLFYLLVFQQPPLWMTSCDQLYPFATKEAFALRVREKVESEYQSLSQSQPQERSLFQQLTFVLLKMLRLNPLERVSIDKVIEELQAILATLKDDYFLPERIRRDLVQHQVHIP